MLLVYCETVVVVVLLRLTWNPSEPRNIIFRNLVRGVINESLIHLIPNTCRDDRKTSILGGSK